MSHFRVNSRSRSRAASRPQHVFVTKNMNAQARDFVPQAPQPKQKKPKYAAGEVLKERSSESFNVTRTLTDTTPPSIIQNVLGAYPVHFHGESSSTMVDPLVFGFEEWTRFDVTVGPQGGQPVIATFHEDNDPDNDNRVVITADKLPRRLQMGKYVSVSLTCGGHMKVYVHIQGNVRSYTDSISLEVKDAVSGVQAAVGNMSISAGRAASTPPPPRGGHK